MSRSSLHLKQREGERGTGPSEGRAGSKLIVPRGMCRLHSGTFCRLVPTTLQGFPFLEWGRGWGTRRTKMRQERRLGHLHHPESERSAPPSTLCPA